MKARTRLVAAFALLSAFSAWADDTAAMKALTAKAWTVPELGLKMALIPAGTFTMGSPKDEAGRRPDEVQHEVTIGRPFYMGVCEVTQGQFYHVMAPAFDHGSWPFCRGPLHAGLALFYRERKGGGDYQGGKLMLQNPMECVTWDRAREFCRKVTDREREAGRLPEGYVYRLPTEAEWEYACRAGTKGPYNVKATNDTVEVLTGEEYLDAFANVGHGCPLPVGERKPNAWGLHDMHGNVSEWCLDWYGPYPTNGVTGSVISPQVDPAGPAEGKKRVGRGGCFNGPLPYAPPGVIARADMYSSSLPFLRSASRDSFHPDVNFYAILGFRVVLGRDAMAPGDAGRPAVSP